MASNIQRMGDVNSAGGAITSIPQGTVYANGKLVAVNGSIGTSHPTCDDDSSHCEGNWKTAGGSSTVYVNGIPVNRAGDTDTCGHPRVAGSSDIFVG